MGSPSPSSAASRLPWRSAVVGWAVFAAAVAVGVPLYLRMPLWIDVTLYDVAARNILTGGVHYRDVFDTNPPGFVWALCVIRSVVGWSIEALRVVDLLVVGTIGCLLLRTARAGGATRGGVAWAAAGMAGFYLFISEFNHVQRDTWMMLPALLAAGGRFRRVAAAGGRTEGWVFRTAVVEGLVWGAAVWIKPHVFPVAVTVWAAVQGELAATVPPDIRRRRMFCDLSGVLAGGVLAGAAGLGWIVGTGAWPAFYEVMTFWNTGYFTLIMDEFGPRSACQLGYFPPWSLFVILAVPVAVANVLDARPWRVPESGFELGPAARRLPGWLYTPPCSAAERTARARLAVLYLAWVATALGLQRQFHYVHVPETLLMIAVLAANRWAAAAVALLMEAAVMTWLALIPVMGWSPPPAWRWEGKWFRHLVWTYPDHSPERLHLWPACVAGPVSGEVRNGVAFQSDYFSGTNLAELEEVAEFLRNEGVKDGELMAFNDSPHVLYLMLDVRPGLRFMHLSTPPAIGGDQFDRTQAEVEAALDRHNPRVRFVVSDIKRLSVYLPPPVQWRWEQPGPRPDDQLPSVVDDWDRELRQEYPGSSSLRELFPLDQPTVFRSGKGRGRYVVHVPTKRPIGPIFSPW